MRVCVAFVAFVFVPEADGFLSRPIAPRKQFSQLFVGRASRLRRTDEEARFAKFLVDALAHKDRIVKLRIERQGTSLVLGRTVLIKKQRKLQLTYKQRGACDVMRNFGRADLLHEELMTAMSDAVKAKATITSDVESWTHSLVRGGQVKSTMQVAPGPPPSLRHDRVKVRALEALPAFFEALQLVNADGTTRPGREKKLAQIHRFAELLEHAVREARLPSNATVVDFGCGRGYLTFAAHELLCRKLGLDARVIGVERRRHLVDEANGIVAELGISGSLSFCDGDIADFSQHVDVVIALHACDTATDDAIFNAIQSEAALIVVAPCCHKEVRPQLDTRLAALRSARPQGLNIADSALLDLASHGVLANRHAEHVTDTMRAILLEIMGYRSKIIEWVPLEHTAKNTMLLGAKLPCALHESADAADRLIRLAAYNGVTRHHLATLLRVSLALNQSGVYKDDRQKREIVAPSSTRRMPRVG